MRHVSPLRSVALSCNIKITYVTLQNVEELLGVNAIILFDTLVFKFVCIHFILGDFLKYVTQAEVCY